MFKENFKYKTLTAIRYLGDGFFYPFFALYLVTRGLAEARIGFILSISPLLAIIMNPIYSRLCNNVRKLKTILGIISILEGLMILIIGFSSNFYLISGLTLLMAIFGSCHYGLMDSLLAIYSDNTKQNYSGIRLFGSGAYIIATSVGGLICEVVSYQLAFGVSCILFIISGLLYLILKNITIHDETKEKTKERGEYKVVLKNKRFVLFMVFYGVMMALIFSNNSFFSTYLETRGIGSDGFGLVYSYFVATELIMLLIFTNIKKKLSPYVLLIVSSLSLVLRLIPCYLYAPVWLVIASSGLRGIGYAIILHVSYQYVVDLLGEKRATIGIMLCTLIYSILLFAFNNANGHLIESFGYKSFYLISLIASLVLLVYSVFITIYNKKITRDPREELKSLIGKDVSGIIDRPLGSHHPEYHEMIYPVNYGYIEGMVAGDNENQDAYFLGETEPLETFSGKVIAIIKRLDDIEDKLVVSKDGKDYSDQEIEELVHFQEQYFKHKIIRK